MSTKKKLGVFTIIAVALFMLFLPVAANLPNTFKGATGADGQSIVGPKGDTGATGPEGPSSTVTYIFWINGTTAQNFQVTCTATKEQLNSATNQTFVCTVVVT